MMCDQGIPTTVWEAATSTIVYIQKKCPQAILEDKTPQEVFIDEKLEVGHLRTFDSQVYIHVPKERRMKMKTSGTKGTFVHQNETSKYYRIYVPGQ